MRKQVLRFALLSYKTRLVVILVSLLRRAMMATVEMMVGTTKTNRLKWSIELAIFLFVSRRFGWWQGTAGLGRPLKKRYGLNCLSAWSDFFFFRPRINHFYLWSYCDFEFVRKNRKTIGALLEQAWRRYLWFESSRIYISDVSRLLNVAVRLHQLSRLVLDNWIWSSSG